MAYQNVEKEIERLKKYGRFSETDSYIQHGSYSVYDHCVRVAKLSIRIQRFFHISVNEKYLIRGALLHDYFLYDWHISKKGHSRHGIMHPKIAWANTSQDYDLTYIEKDIILHHMFPLTLIPPKCKEAWIVCIADKICATQEILTYI